MGFAAASVLIWLLVAMQIIVVTPISPKTAVFLNVTVAPLAIFATPWRDLSKVNA